MRVKLGQGETMQRAEHLRDSPLPPLDLEGRKGEEAKTELIRDGPRESQRTAEGICATCHQGDGPPETPGRESLTLA